ncbi:MAG: hypothetical protein NTY88_15060 [Bacteroidetes bacterium]|nr:hypothetical protein [Bacteroidota bacterium]
MKSILVITVSLFLACSFNSCKNCTTCTRYPNVNDKFEMCKKDYSDDSYNQAYRYYESLGYKCQ